MVWKKDEDTSGKSIGPAGDMDKPESSKPESIDGGAGKLMGGKSMHERLNDKMSKSWGCS